VTPRDDNIALLIDADNASHEQFDQVLLVLGELGGINIRRAYGNWQKPALRGWGDLSTRHSIVPVQQFDVVKGKSATDMRMIIDAMDLLYRGNVDGFGIMSSDSDFLPLVQRIRENGLPVYGFGTAKTPISFQNSCTRFFDVVALALGSQAGDAPAPVTSGPVGTRPAKPAVDPELIDVLVNAWNASKRDEDNFASLSEVGQRAKAVTSFSVRNYGFSRLTDLMRSLPGFQVKSREDGTLLVRRLT
jgi:uncharacterized protein (TIGR00288 family)